MFTCGDILHYFTINWSVVSSNVSGSGATAKVFVAKHRRNEQEVAVKLIDRLGNLVGRG